MAVGRLGYGELAFIVVVPGGGDFDSVVTAGERGHINGAAAHLVNVGDTVIIISYALMDFEEAKTFTPTVVFPNDNHI